MLHNFKKKIDGDDEGEWIMSYADTVTLLLCFFVIFFSESSFDSKSDQKESVDLASSVEAEQILTTDVQRKEHELRLYLSKLKKEMHSRLQKENLSGYQINQDERSVSIRLQERSFFKLGSYKLTSQGVKKLERLSASLLNMQDDIRIQIEGHTDQTPVKKGAIYTSNIGLSALRATAASDVFLSQGFDKKKITIVGFGETQPVYKNRNLASEGKEQVRDEQASRRIEIRVYPTELKM